MNKVLRVVLFVVLAISAGSALDRNAVTFTRYDLNVRIIPEQHAMDVEGAVTLRNDSSVPQSNVALQISSSLTWQRIAINGEMPSFITHAYTTDIDHTGALSEAVVTLDKPLEPKGSVTLQVHYSGTITRDATRLTRIGTPATTASRSDWDQISPSFTAVRGIGYVTWYPISTEAVSLSNGDEFFNAIAAWRRRSIAVNACFVSDVADANSSAWITNGENHGYTSSQKRAYCRTFTQSSTPTFVFGPLAPIDREHLTIYSIADHISIARDYVLAAEKAETTLESWFNAPQRKPVIVELTDSDALPFEDGAFLFTPLKKAPPIGLEVALARTMAHASFDSPRAWIREGLATFAQALVREQQQGRKAGLMYLNEFVNALSVAEVQAKSTMQDGESSSKAQLPSIGAQPLTQTHDELFYRTKAAFVWWMLRDMLGDDAIKTFISRYRPQDDHEPSYAQILLENAGTTHHDLEPFFDSWVYADRGLPQLSMVAAYGREILAPTATARPNYVVTLTVENNSDVWVEVPVVVRAGKDETSVRVTLDPHSKVVARTPFAAVPEEAIVNDGSVPESDLSDNRIAVQVARPATSPR